jgi:phosphatidate cytidylyltransferase
MITRIITSLVALCVLIPVLFLANTVVLPIAIAISCVIAIGEALNCIGVLKKAAVSVPLLAAAAFLSVWGRFCDSISDFLIVFACVIFIEVLYFMAVLVFFKGALSITDLSAAVFISFYITVGYCSIVLLHDHFEGGKYTYLLIFVGAWITDIFAYFCGRLFGKHKLIPEISPKKTVEGSIGGTLFTGVSFVVFGVIADALALGINQGHLQLFLFGIAAALVAQIGDLCMYALKRHYGIKDFGKIFPGHGGMLDRFDSIIAVSVVLLVLNLFVNYIF